MIKVFVTEVQADSAVLRARINSGGADTTYHFEYGTGVCSIEPDPCSTPTAKEEIPIGHGRTFRSVSAPLSNLQPSTVYHYRVIASNEESPQGGTAGPEQTFTTFPFVSQLSDRCPNAQPRRQTGASLLLDCRAYELVSAPDTGGFDVESDLVEGQTPFPSSPKRRLPQANRVFSIASMTVASPIRVTRLIVGSIPTSPPAVPMAGPPNTSASRPMALLPPFPSHPPCSKPMPGSTPSPSAARKSAGPVSLTAAPVFQSTIQAESWSRA